MLSSGKFNDVLISERLLKYSSVLSSLGGIAISPITLILLSFLQYSRNCFASLALYILEIGRNYKNIINNYNFINEYCTENIFEEKKFFNEIPFSKNNNYEFQKIYMENIVPHFNKVCINFKEIEDFEKYEIAVKLIDPNFEYEKTVKKINEIINYTFDNIFSDEGILIEIQD